VALYWFPQSSQQTSSEVGSARSAPHGAGLYGWPKVAFASSTCLRSYAVKLPGSGSEERPQIVKSSNRVHVCLVDLSILSGAVVVSTVGFPVSSQHTSSEVGSARNFPHGAGLNGASQRRLRFFFLLCIKRPTSLEFGRELQLYLLPPTECPFAKGFGPGGTDRSQARFMRRARPANMTYGSAASRLNRHF
jgi:hypothetical protein